MIKSHIRMARGIREGSGCGSELKSEALEVSLKLGKGGGIIGGTHGRTCLSCQKSSIYKGPEVMASSVDLGSGSGIVRSPAAGYKIEKVKMALDGNKKLYYKVNLKHVLS